MTLRCASQWKLTTGSMTCFGDRSCRKKDLEQREQQVARKSSSSSHVETGGRLNGQGKAEGVKGNGWSPGRSGTSSNCSSLVSTVAAGRKELRTTGGWVWARSSVAERTAVVCWKKLCPCDEGWATYVIYAGTWVEYDEIRLETKTKKRYERTWGVAQRGGKAKWQKPEGRGSRGSRGFVVEWELKTERSREWCCGVKLSRQNAADTEWACWLGAASAS